MERVQERDPGHRWEGLSLALTDHKGITAIHGRYLGLTKTTDVISFAYPPEPFVADGFCGEVIVNVQQAIEQGARYLGTARELALYISHGCHHLTGADDASPAQRRHMRRVETRWLDQAAEAGLITPILAEQDPLSPGRKSGSSRRESI